VKPFPFKRKGRGQFALTVSTDTLGVILRAVGYYIKKAERDIIGIETHDGEPKKKNTVGKEVSTLKTNNSARY
jgi:hypothetical protein